MPRKKKASAVVEAVEAAPIEAPKPPTCTTCAVELTWRDLAYTGDSGLCKRCHARVAKSAIQGKFAPMIVKSLASDGQPAQRMVVSNRGRRRQQAHDTHLLAPQTQRPRYVPSVRFAVREPGEPQEPGEHGGEAASEAAEAVALAAVV